MSDCSKCSHLDDCGEIYIEAVNEEAIDCEFYIERVAACD